MELIIRKVGGGGGGYWGIGGGRWEFSSFPPLLQQFMVSINKYRENKSNFKSEHLWLGRPF